MSTFPAPPDGPAAVARPRSAVTASAGAPSRHIGRRIAWGVGGVLTALVLAVGVAEALGWPFLAGPMQRILSRTLDRPVYLEGAMAASSTVSQLPAVASGTATSPPRSAGGVRLKLLGRVEVRAHRIEIAAPAWSQRPPLLVAEDARIRMRYTDLWRAARGEPLRVHLIEAASLQMDLERLADGRASWQFGPPKPPGETPAPMPVFESLRVTEGRLAVRDALLDTQIDARFSLHDSVPVSAVASGKAASDASAPGTRARQAESPRASATGAAASPPPGVVAAAGLRPNAPGLRAEATGRYRRLPLTLSLQTVGVLPWVADDASHQSVPLTIEGSVGRARLRFDGSVRDVQRLAGLVGEVRLAGPSLAAVGDVIGVTLPTTPAFSSRGLLRKKGEVWQLRVDQADIGRSRLNAELRYDPTLARPLLSGRVGGPRLLLADLGPAIGLAGPVTDPVAAPAATRGRVLPTREFDLPALRAMDADVQLSFDELDLGTTRLQPLEPMRTRLLLKDGLLVLRDIDARTADGRLQGQVSLDGRDTLAVWRTDLRWSEVHLEQWLNQTRANGAPPYVTGRLDGRARLSGRGRSTAQILASLEGELFGRVRQGTLSHLLVEGAGLDLAQALGVFLRGDDALPMDCAIADLRVSRGVAKPRAMVIDTRDSVVWIDGQLSLADESLDLRAVVAPRDFSPLALRTPIKVQGSLSDPRVSLSLAPIAGKLAASALLALVNPLAALLPLIDPGSDVLPANVPGGCRRLAQQAAQQPRS